MSAEDEFHRWDGEYLNRREWAQAPREQRRVERALGPEPIPNARYLLARIQPLAPQAKEADGTAGSGVIDSLDTAAQMALRLRFAQSVEIRLVATGRRFPSRDVWRAAYALGLRWGEMDLFHWSNPGGPVAGEKRLFTISALGEPGFFLPERAEEGEAVAGLALSFELPPNPVPLATFDRMTVALGYFRQQLGGRPAAWDGGDFDHDRLYAERDALEDAIVEMRRWGIPSGSAAAARFF